MMCQWNIGLVLGGPTVNNAVNLGCHTEYSQLCKLEFGLVELSRIMFSAFRPLPCTFIWFHLHGCNFQGLSCSIPLL